MDSLQKLGLLLQEVNTVYNNINVSSKQINELTDENELFKNKILELEFKFQTKEEELNNMVKKYNEDIFAKDKVIIEKLEEIANFTKISCIQKVNKQLNDKNNYIQILESQLEKFRNVNKPLSPKLVNIELQIDNKIKEFELDNFEDINGYELIQYKKKYYLRDLETNELYNISDNKPNKVVGLINSKSKVKFN
jgi:hypothetical protein